MVLRFYFLRMIFYKNEVLLGLLIASIPAIGSIYYYIIGEKKRTALLLLLLSAFLIRILMISLDPFLHDWDERFHALVAKNMMENPMTPMLFKKHIFPYSISDWGYNHIWVHKQPLFLWQMALSMKLFGVNVIALRLPSAILGTIMVWLTYDIAKKWVIHDHVAFISAFLSAFAFFALELTSGWMSLEHNDLTFIFYMTCCYWAFTRYVHSGHQIQWTIAIGVFAGLAILNKWLVGLLIFGGWGLYLLISEHRSDIKKYVHLGVAGLITCIVFVPWQLYILNRFPAESALAFESNRRHITEDLGHPGNVFYHVSNLLYAYHPVLLGFLILGIGSILFSKTVNKKITISFLVLILVLLLFFSLLVATKMPAFVYPVSALLFILMAYGIYIFSQTCSTYLKSTAKYRALLLGVITIVGGYCSLKPLLIGDHRLDSNQLRNTKMHNATIYKHIPDSIAANYVIFNCRSYENIELMFYKNTLAYHFYPDENTLDSLQESGIKFAAFDYPNERQSLPEYITTDPEILILEGQPR